MGPQAAPRPEDCREPVDVSEPEVELKNFTIISQINKDSSYINVEIAGQQARGMMDSGNTFGTVISMELSKRLGYDQGDLEPLETPVKVGTAHKDGNLTVLGKIPKSLEFTIGNYSEPFMIKPFVVDGLNMELNLGKEFMSENAIDELHSEQVLRHKGVKIPMNNATSVSNILVVAYAKESRVIEPGESVELPLTVPDWTNVNSQFHGYLEADPLFYWKTTCLPERNRTKMIAQLGNLNAQVMNITDSKVVIPKGIRYGEVMALEMEPFCATVQAAENSEEDMHTLRSKIQKSFKLDSDTCVLKDPVQRKRAEDLLLSYHDLFSWDGSYGRTDLVVHRIPLKPGTKPVAMRSRPVNPVLEESLKAQIDKWLKEGIIRESQSEWNAGLVVVPKKTPPGQPQKYRFCIDYRALNQASVKDRYYIGDVNSNLSRLENVFVMSTLDGASAYHSIPIHKSDQHKTSFNTPWASYMFTYLPFGLANAPSCFARLMDLVLKGIPPTKCLPFLDDVLVYNSSLEEHFETLEEVLAAHRKAGLKLNPQKCTFFQSRVQYLGHEVSREGTKPLPTFQQLISNWPCPTNRYECRVFLGKISYYRRFIHRFVELAKPLLDKLAQNGTADDHPFGKDPAIEKCTEVLKKALLEAPVLAHPQFKSPNPFILDTDYSARNRAIAGCLSQVQDGQERVISMAAKRLTKSQRMYSPFKGELCATLHFMRHFNYYLIGRKFILRIDNSALKYIHTIQSPSGMIERWLLTLSLYDFEVQHRLSRAHGNADGASRAPHLEEPDGSTQDVEDGMGNMTINQIKPPIQSEVWATKDWLEAQKNDDELHPLIKALLKGEKPVHQVIKSLPMLTQVYFGLFTDLHLNDQGILCYRKVTDASLSPVKKRSVFLVPREWWEPALRKVHDNNGHPGIANTLERAHRYFYFNGMQKIAEYVVKSCQPCQATRPKPSDQRHTYRPVVSGFPWQRLAIDYVGPMPTSTRGNRYIFTCICTFSRWIEAFPVRSCTTEAAVGKLVTEVFPRFGLCEYIQQDRGSHFTSNLAYDVAQALGIKQTFTPSYNPKSNGILERAHGTLGRMLKALCKDKPNQWELYLPQCLFAMRTARSKTTNSTPFQLIFGHEASMPLDLLFAVPHPSPELYEDQESYANSLRNRILCAHAWARKHMRAAIERQRRNYHKDRKGFEPHQKVWLYTPSRPVGVSSKLYPYWSGPWIIDKAVNDVVYRILPDPSWERKQAECVSIDRLKPYFEQEYGGENFMRPPSKDADLSMPGDEFAETLPPDEENEEELVTEGEGVQVPAEPLRPDAVPPQLVQPEPEPIRPDEPVDIAREQAQEQPPPNLPQPVMDTPGGTRAQKRAQRLAEEAELVYGKVEGKRNRRTM